MKDRLRRGHEILFGRGGEIHERMGIALILAWPVSGAGISLTLRSCKPTEWHGPATQELAGLAPQFSLLRKTGCREQRYDVKHDEGHLTPDAPRDFHLIFCGYRPCCLLIFVMQAHTERPRCADDPPGIDERRRVGWVLNLHALIAR